MRYSLSEINNEVLNSTEGKEGKKIPEKCFSKDLEYDDLGLGIEHGRESFGNQVEG